MDNNQRQNRQRSSQQTDYNSRSQDVPSRANPRDAGNSSYQRPQAPDVKLNHTSSSGNSKKLILALGAIGAIAAAIGIGAVVSNMGKVEIVNVTPYSVTAQQPYQACHEVGTTSYVRNHKDGTKGAIIGGATGAGIGGVIGGVATHTATGALIGAGIGGAVGAVSGDLIQKSNEPDYIKKHGHKTECETAYKNIQVPVGYQVSYMEDKAEQQIVTQHAPQVGTKVKLEELQADQVTTQQQQQLVQQAISGNAPAAGQAATPQ